VKLWHKDVKERADKNVVICIAGNKMDLKYDQDVKIQDGEEWAKVKLIFRIYVFFMLIN